jgi:hypothetical protein
MPLTTVVAVRMARCARDQNVREDQGRGSSLQRSCDGCGRKFNTESALSRHLDTSEGCSADLQAAETRRLGHLLRDDETINETSSETEKMAIDSPSPIPEEIPETMAQATPGEGVEAAPAGPGLTESDDGRGRFVERFPGEAGEPISPHVAHQPGLESYIKSCGRMARPEWFSVAELLTTTKMTDKARTRHLKHEIVSRGC